MFARPRGSRLDALAVALCLVVALDRTPGGALIRASIAWARGTTAPSRTLLSFFSGGLEDGRSEPVQVALPLPEAPLPEADALAFAAAGVGAQLDDAGRARWLALASELGVRPFAVDSPRALKALLDALSPSLGGVEGAVAALHLPRTTVAFAVERCRRAGVAPELAQLARQLPSGQALELAGAARLLAAGLAFGLDWPLLPSARITSPFGLRRHPTLGIEKLHTGIDLSAVVGTEIRAVADGVVRRAGEDAVNGRVVLLDHGRGVTTGYAHASELLVHTGDHVRRGQVVARSGSTGRSTGPHLHYQLELSGQPVDPRAFRGVPLGLSHEGAGQD